MKAWGFSTPRVFSTHRNYTYSHQALESLQNSEAPPKVANAAAQPVESELPKGTSATRASVWFSILITISTKYEGSVLGAVFSRRSPGEAQERPPGAQASPYPHPLLRWLQGLFSIVSNTTQFATKVKVMATMLLFTRRGLTLLLSEKVAIR